MLDTQQLLYILPDLAYLAEFLPGKQPHTFTVASFKQFNGKLMNDGKLIYENLNKLIDRVQDKLGEAQLDVVLADDVFTNTMINIEKKTEAEVTEYLQDEVIPSLHIDLDSHQIETFILSEYKGVYKVQLATVQHSALAPLKLAFANKKIKLNKIFPLSWTLKSLISLEPSIAMVQMGKNLFMAKHYIGVDQPLTDSLDNLDRFVEAIKTLKGGEASMQTIYLLSDEAVETELTKKLAGIMPIQQLAETESGDAALPGYVDKAMTTAMRTIEIEEFEIPEFKLSAVKISAELEAKIKASAEDQSESEEAIVAEEIKIEDLPKPGEAVVAKTMATAATSLALESQTAPVAAEVETLADTLDSDLESVATTTELESDLETQDELEDSTVAPKEVRAYQPVAATLASLESEEAELEDTKHDPYETAVEEPDPVDLAKFANNFNDQPQSTPKTVTTSPTMKKTNTLKNDDGTSNLLRILLIGFGSFAITVAIGVGIGFGVLKLSQPKTVEEPVVTQVEPEPTVEPTPTPVPEIERLDYTIRVVNATTKAGYAGQIAAILEEKEYQTVEAKNAVDSYEAGNYLLMAEENEALLQTISKDLELELTFVKDSTTEDPKGEFDAVVVLADN